MTNDNDETVLATPSMMAGLAHPHEVERVAEATPVTALEMYRALKTAWLGCEDLVMIPPKRESLLVLMAQWAIETGRGEKMMNFNIGNFKSVPGDGRDFTYFTTSEQVSIGAAHAALATGLATISWEKADQGLALVVFHPKSPVTRFRAYDTLEHGATDYVQSLHHRFSQAWIAVESGDPRVFAHLLKVQGYYTASEKDYADALAARYLEYGYLSDDPTTPDLEKVRGIKKALSLLGYDVGVVDDNMDHRAQNALMDFQRAHACGVDGKPGPESRRALSKALALLSPPISRIA